jgi:V/A-type H+-transporting ATPase subunit I
MIVKMKKVTLVVTENSKNASLETLRDIGLVHISSKAAPNEKLNEAALRKAKAENALAILQTYAPKKHTGSGGQNYAPDDADLVEYVNALAEKKQSLADENNINVRELSRFEKWGEVDPHALSSLSEGGVTLIPYELEPKSFAALDVKAIENIEIIKLGEDKKSVRFVTVGASIPGVPALQLPPSSTSKLAELVSANRGQIAKAEGELKALARNLKPFIEAKNRAATELEFETAAASMEGLAFEHEGLATFSPPEAAAIEKATSVSLIQGYVPDSDLGKLKRAASENSWALIASDPAPDDEEVPTKLKNNGVVSLIYPLTKFLDMNPGYHEKDISVWFLIFFVVFFGIIFGDAGYGAVLLLISLFGMAKTAKKGIPAALKGLCVLAVSNIIWGAVTCTWFGLQVSLVPAPLKTLSLSWLSTAKGTPSDVVDQHLMQFCFTLALIHLSVAHLISLADKLVKKSLSFVGEVGQLLMIFGMYRVVLCLVVFKPSGFQYVPLWAYGLIGAGFALGFIFANYEDSLVQSILASLSNIIPTILGVTNVFSDIMSYIRLWAVGLAGASIASTVDIMAGPLFGHFVFFVFGIALLVFGHGFNMILNVLSVLVHGVRLNTLEFSSNTGLGWTGFEYKPFAKR